MNKWTVFFSPSGMPITILRAQTALLYQRRGWKFCEKVITGFECTLLGDVSMSKRVFTIDPVVFRDVCAYVVLVRWRPQGACERSVFSQEV